MTSVVLVTDRHSLRSALRPALGDAGYAVIDCVGPQPPSYMCQGSRCGWCPLAESADALVLDADVAGDRVGAGTKASDLVRLYGRMKRPVVVLADPAAALSKRFQDDRDVHVLALDAAPRTVVSAVATIAHQPSKHATDRSEPEELAGPKRWIEGTTIAVDEL